MRRTIVEVLDSGRNRYVCPHCGGKRSRKLTQGQVFLEAATYPAPNVEVRECNSCGQYHELDRWLLDRSIWRGSLG